MSKRFPDGFEEYLPIDDQRIYEWMMDDQSRCSPLILLQQHCTLHDLPSPGFESGEQGKMSQVSVEVSGKKGQGTHVVKARAKCLAIQNLLALLYPELSSYGELESKIMGEKKQVEEKSKSKSKDKSKSKSKSKSKDKSKSKSKDKSKSKSKDKSKKEKRLRKEQETTSNEEQRSKRQRSSSSLNDPHHSTASMDDLIADWAKGCQSIPMLETHPHTPHNPNDATLSRLRAAMSQLIVRLETIKKSSTN